MSDSNQKPPRYTNVQVDVTSTPEFQTDVEALFGDFMRLPEVKALPQGKQTDDAVMAIARVVALRDYEDVDDEDEPDEVEAPVIAPPNPDYVPPPDHPPPLFTEPKPHGT